MEGEERWPALLATTEVSLVAADVMAVAGDGPGVRRMLELAQAEARRELGALDSWFVVWREWDSFSQACSAGGLVSWLPLTRLLRGRVATARAAFRELLAKAEWIRAGTLPDPGLGDALEELLMQVWRCEDEWRLDDRIDASLGVRRAR